MGAALDGVVVVDKEAGWTSHDVVAKLRSVLQERRIGHAGTLDPSATGVLVAAVGRSTRLLRFLGETTKRYRGEVTLGVATDTLDATGRVTSRVEMDGIALAQVRAAAARLVGALTQVPPMVSAVKIDGRRLHELHREGKEVERPARRVHIYSIDVEQADAPGVFEIVVACSGGTYVRVIAAELGELLGGVAHLSALRRTDVGLFSLADAHLLGGLDASCVQPPLRAVAHLERLRVTGSVATQISFGRPLRTGEVDPSGAGPFALVGEDSALLAVYERDERGLVPAVVMVPA